MQRLVYTIDTPKGFLKDIEEHTDDILEAVTFTSFEAACTRIAAVSGLLTTDCWLQANYIPFPRPNPAPPLPRLQP